MLATLENTADPMAWSGAAVEIRKALADAVETLTVVDHIPVKKTPVHAALRLALGKYSNNEPRYPLWMREPALREFARVTAEAMERHRPQALLCISSQCLIYLKEYYRGLPVPTFSFSDTPWMKWLEVYKQYWPRPVGAAAFAAREAAALPRCTGLIYGSEWARQDAMARFDVPPEKVHVQPMGAGLTPTANDAEIEAAVLARPKDCVNLVFVGREWDRKGGPLALAIARGLRDSGKVGPVRLHIVGTRPEIAAEDESLVEVHGLLRRDEPAENRRLRQLLMESHFLVVPTIAECFGLVFAEAQAFALPPVSRAVNAIPSIILDGRTGLIQPAEDGAEPYVRRMLDLLDGDRSAYVQMAMAARRHFHERLNWAAFGSNVANIMGSALQRLRPPTRLTVPAEPAAVRSWVPAIAETHGNRPAGGYAGEKPA